MNGFEEPRAWLEPGRIKVRAAGHDWTLFRPGNLEERWEALGDDGLDRIPYWLELWPSSLVLADWLRLRKGLIRGQACLDLGCGMGFTAIAARRLGADVIAADHELEALAFGARNAAANNVPGITWLAMDWNRGALKAKSLRLAWAADIAYEARFQRPLLDLLGEALADDGIFWLAEPGRTVFRGFLEAARKSGWDCVQAHRGAAPDPHAAERLATVSIWQFSKKAANIRSDAWKMK